MKKTFKQMRDFNSKVTRLLTGDPTILKTKFGYALKKVGTEINKYFDEYSLELDTIRVNNALEDPTTKALLIAPEGSQRQYLYSKEGTLKLMKEETALLKEWDVKEFEFKPFYVPLSYAPELDQDEIDALGGFVIEEPIEE